MTDITTKERLIVSNEGKASPFMMVPEQQLDAIRTVLDEHCVRYWVDEESIAVDDEPPVTFINFARGTDAEFVQKLLDSIP